MLDTEKLITIQPAKVIRILGIIVVLLVLANLAVHIMRFVEWIPNTDGFVCTFDMNVKHAAPTYFTTVIVLIAAFLLNTIAAFKKRNGHSYALHWRILAIIFLFLSMVEAVTIDEWANTPTQKILGTVWLLPAYAWVIPGSVLVLIFALSYCRFLLHLPLKSRLLFSIAGVLYVGSAIGIDLVGGYYANIHGYGNFTYNMIATIEETLAMAGIILFIYALSDYIGLNIKEIRFRIGSRLSINKGNGKKSDTQLHLLGTEKLITIQPAKIIRILGFVVALLVLANVATKIIKFAEWSVFLSRLYQFFSFEQITKIVYWIPKVKELSYLFDVSDEGNVPAYFSTVIILMAVLLLNTIAAFKKRTGHSYALHWRILAIIFLYLSIDEAVTIHEWASAPTQKILGIVWGIPGDSWVIPASVLVIVFALSYCRFLLHLPLKSRLLFLIAGVLYVGGAIGMELVASRYNSLYGYNNLIYHMIGTVEETLEMVGIILFIYALLDYIRVNIKDMRIRIGGAG